MSFRLPVNIELKTEGMGEMITVVWKIKNSQVFINYTWLIDHQQTWARV